MKHKKEEIYLDLSKCSEQEQIKAISLLPNPKFDNQYEINNMDFMLSFDENDQWWVFGYEILNKQEISFPEFCELFQDEKAGAPISKEVLQVENNGWVKIENTDQRYPDQDVWVCSSHVNGNVFFHHAFGYIPRDFTHYQPIIKPETPIF